MGLLPSLLSPPAADAGIILLFRNPPHWWKVRLASFQIFSGRAEQDAVFWWRAPFWGVFRYSGKWGFWLCLGCLWTLLL